MSYVTLLRLDSVNTFDRVCVCVCITLPETFDLVAKKRGSESEKYNCNSSSIFS